MAHGVFPGDDWSMNMHSIASSPSPSATEPRPFVHPGHVAVLFPMLSAGLTSDDRLLDLQHVLMLPAMLGAMLYRRSEYGL